MNGVRELIADMAKIKGYIFFAATLFLAGVAVGYATDVLDPYLVGQADSMRDLVERLDRMNNSQVWMFLFIFFNNFLKALAVVFLGALFGIIPVIMLAINGLLIGYVFSAAADNGLHVGSLFVRGILPHGVLEITAIVIAAAFGMRYGTLILRELVGALRGRSGDESGELKRFHKSLGRLTAFLFFALLAAAFIESTVTFWLVRG
ncbi:stage II sporulation protein M [Paenibacillus thermotolerans]|uniref:stage II sporulation protein M n=1 Tax=Paenibacillus thermotolerans TaxID=3027807 RepID=UPI002368685F|nr:MULTISPECIES: stage II sporulation protein M [unclassified Paenibacillus]